MEDKMIEIKNIKYYTLSEVAKHFNVSKQTISRWRREKLLSGFRIRDRKFIFSEQNIEDFIKCQ